MTKLKAVMKKRNKPGFGYDIVDKNILVKLVTISRATVMLVTSLRWLLKLVTICECCRLNVDVGDIF